MANIIDYTYFDTPELSIPMGSRDELRGAITSAITMYEDEILRLLLGYKTWKEMKQAYDASIAETPVALAEKWNKLINGAEFEYSIDGETYFDRWIGLKNASKISLIANYVYFYHRRNNVSQNTGIGETVIAPKDSKLVSPYAKQVVAWNRMIDMYGELDAYGIAYPYPSAYNFLNTYSTDYPDWKFVRMEKIVSPFRMWS